MQVLPDTINFKLLLRGTAEPCYLADAYLQVLGHQSIEAELATSEIVRIDRERLLTASLDSHAYGQQLSQMLFATPALRTAWTRACSYAGGASATLRFNLSISATEQPLQMLLWERLLDPESGEPIFLNGRTLFTRYVESADLRPLGIGIAPPLHTLVIVANPSDLATFQLQPINVAQVVKGLDELGANSVTFIARELTGLPATRSHLLQGLQQGAVMLYLVCHGTINSSRHYLWLEHADGTSDQLSGDELCTLVAGLPQRPALIILGACQSAGTSHDPLAALSLGAELVRAGIPAVVGMLDNPAQATVYTFTKILLRELARHGTVDRAVAVARASILDSNDWWKPVLFSRVADGRILIPKIVSGTSHSSWQRGLPAPVLIRLRKTLAHCDEFASHALLRTLFVDEHLQPWRDGLPEADSVAARVALTIDYLLTKRRADTQQGLPLLLEALLQQYDPADERYEALKAITVELSNPSHVS